MSTFSSFHLFNEANVNGGSSALKKKSGCTTPVVTS